jgi:Tfp pilus assembly protein PilX
MAIESDTSRSTPFDSRGFTLIATLMLLLIMSGIAIGLLMMVNTEGKVGSQDTQNNLAFHAAEGGIEHMTSDLANMFQNIESPQPTDITSLSADAPPSTAFMSYPVYSLTPATNANGTLATNWGQIASGTYQGLFAQLLPVNLQVTATTSLAGLGTVGDEVNMSRTIEVALIPVFQFGVFSDSDLGFFSSPNLNFAGRVHTNGDLYLGVANGFTLTFTTNLRRGET